MYLDKFNVIEICQNLILVTRCTSLVHVHKYSSFPIRIRFMKYHYIGHGHKRFVQTAQS